MKTTRLLLDSVLFALEVDLPTMLERTPDADRMQAFAVIAAMISESARLEDRAHIWKWLQRIRMDLVNRVPSAKPR
ncbi:hypothetical protein [Pseudoxanthomonas putridarboris]|uniref:Uncharacterized protein n=1 Tax=Pseudoxanthomonas putridarboris TaxID=752605 RepID=A0ABU9J0T6_9GAMM